MGARLRGDYGRIRIGERTSVQENVVIHARENGETVVGRNVQLGHGCILHNCTVRDNAVIGLGAILTDFSVVGDWAIVGEGAVVRGEVPDGKIAVGIPARILGDVTAEQKAEWQYYKDKYAELAATRYPAGTQADRLSLPPTVRAAARRLPRPAWRGLTVRSNQEVLHGDNDCAAPIADRG